MTPTTILITGGAGFVGSNLCIHLKQVKATRRVIALDNLRRRGSELNVPRLREAGVEFVHGDIRNPEDLDVRGDVDLLIECSAEPSVMAGFGSSPDYVIRTNLVGTLNLLEFCRRRGSKLLFLSTSRVYPIQALCDVRLEETAERFEVSAEQAVAGISPRGVTEAFPLDGARSLYGATKLGSELFIREYEYAYGLQAIINRFGVIAGPWQMGKIDQGFVVLWLAQHLRHGSLSYIGFNGSGKQVRDVLHVADVCELIDLQVAKFEALSGQVFNVGGGRHISVSLLELTQLCQDVTGNAIAIQRVAEGRPADIPVYISDATKLREAVGWTPTRGVETLIQDTYAWLCAHQQMLAPIFSS
jgi:CDP-paratose 2-epimerase